MHFVTAFDIAERYANIKEVPGNLANPHIMSMLKLDAKWPQDDSVPWCSAFVNHVAWILRLPRSKSLMARSWLSVGRIIEAQDAQVGYDVVILSRGNNPPGPEVLDAPGHVGFFSGYYPLINKVGIFGANQNDSVCNNLYNMDRMLGIRRLYEET